ncbi:hypothetical protein FOCC_FOCC002838 [Frankliniella occidentalis]|nr:hypothetical protein FOCC_FOCC002838 [Frankliniella occidentalis]
MCRPLMRPNNAKSQSGRWRPRRQARRSRALTADMLILFVALLVQSVAGRSPAGSGGRRAPSISLQLYDLEPCKDEPGNLLVSNFTSVREKNGIYHYYAHVLLKKVLKFISKGKYEMRNATVNMAAIQKLAGSSIGDVLGKVFIAELSLSNEQYQLFSCFKLKASFIGTRT